MGRPHDRRRRTSLDRAKPNGKAKQRRSRARKPAPGNAAYHQRQRAQRDRDDENLLQAMRENPDGLIGEWAAAIGKGRSSTLSGLKRLRDAGLTESVEGKWKLTEEPAAREPPPKWTAPLSAAAGREHRAHAGA